MKYSKRYIAFTLIVAIALLIKFNTVSESYQRVDSFRGADLEAETWNPLIAESVNENLLSVVIDNKEYTNEKYHFYMDSNLNIMVPVTILRDALNCSAHIYDGNRLLVEKHNKELSFSLDAGEVLVNGKREPIVSPFIEEEQQYYVSLNELSQYLDYSYSWNIQENVKREVEEFCGLKVTYVNIHVQGIHFNEKNKAHKQRRTEEDKDI